MLELATADESTSPFTGAVLSARFSGPVSYLTIRLGAGEELEMMHAGEVPRVGTSVALRLRAGAAPLL